MYAHHTEAAMKPNGRDYKTDPCAEAALPDSDHATLIPPVRVQARAPHRGFPLRCMVKRANGRMGVSKAEPDGTEAVLFP